MIAAGEDLKRLACTAVLAASVLWPAMAAAQFCGASDGKDVNFGRYYSDGSAITDGASDVNRDAAGENFRYMRYRLVPGAGDVEWELYLRRGYTVVDSVSSHSFEGTRLPFVWTGRLPVQGGNIRYDLRTLRAPADWRLELDAVVAMPASARNTYYSRQDDTNSQIRPLHDVNNRRLWQQGNPVGLLTMMRTTDTNCCSGVMVASDLFLTNRHCAADLQADCRNGIVDLSWDNDQVSRDMQCEKIILPANDPDIDAVLLRTRPMRETTRVLPAAFRRQPVSTADRVSVIHHPSCRMKSVTPDCTIASVVAATGLVTHKCDTEHGSSGAPILDANGAIVALHREGFQKLANGSCDRLNKAITVDRLLKAFPEEITRNFHFAD